MPKVVRKAQERNAAGRTPYGDYKAMLICFHEAGHIVAAHALGSKVQLATVGNSRGFAYYDTANLLPPFGVQDEAEKLRRITSIRKRIVTVAAGPVAGIIHYQSVEKRGWSCRNERRAYEHMLTVRVSFGYNLQSFQATSNPTSDYTVVQSAAEALFLSGIYPCPVLLGPKPLTKKQQVKYSQAFAKHRSETIHNEILACEKTAEDILNKNWQAVTDIATALHKSKSGKLTRKQLLRHLDRHFGVRVKRPGPGTRVRRS